MTERRKPLPSIRDDWRVVSGGLLRGLSHDLNGRVTGLTAITMALEDGEVDKALDLLTDEAARLDTLGRRLASLAHTYTDPEAVALDEVVEDALALARLDADLVGFEWSCHIQDGTPPALVPRAVFLRSFLAVLTGLARAAARAGAHGAHLEARPLDDDILFTATVLVDDGHADAAVRAFGDAPVFGILTAAAKAFHGRLEALYAKDGEPRVELTVPSIRAPHRQPDDI